MASKRDIPVFKLWEKIIYFFPVQLLFVHLKKNLLLLIFWLLLFAIITKSISLKYGVPYLFLYPEYLGEVSFISHTLVGLASGAFIMAFNISSYAVNGFRFPFLATLNRPFIKYCQNNTIIPLAFSLLYLISAATFQLEYEGESWGNIILNGIGFAFGNALFILITALYFAFTNKNFSSFAILGVPTRKEDFINPISDLFSTNRKWEHSDGTNKKEWKVSTYISKFGRIKIARDSSHYDRATLEKVFEQNRINATFFQTSVIVAIFILGWLSNYDWMMIPAASSILLFFTMLIMLVSAFYSWFKGWTSIILIGILLLFNVLSSKTLSIYNNQAYGLNYDAPKADYSLNAINALQIDSTAVDSDIKKGIVRLENWKRKTGEAKPIAVFLNVPGGGLRSAIWTMQSVGAANQASHGALWKNLVMISGSSGGMIGAAYLREVYYRSDQSELALKSAVTDMGNDKLNPVAATAVLNDFFFRFKSFEYKGKFYTRDRSSAFESKLNRDTHGWLDRSLSGYAELEISAEIPMMLLAPTISNDGRKLLISPQLISYMTQVKSNTELNENIEFTRLFQEHSPGDLSFISALRMSATFPYVFPSANLPTNPEIEILDAGIRDNFGMSNTLRYIYTFKDWLRENTSGVVVIQVRDQQKFNEQKKSGQNSILQSMTQPLSTFYNTILDVQDYQQDEQIRMAKDWYEGDLTMIDLVLERSDNNPISLSWHLTKKEKERIESALKTTYNQYQFSYLERLFAE